MQVLNRDSVPLECTNIQRQTKPRVGRETSLSMRRTVCTASAVASRCRESTSGGPCQRGAEVPPIRSCDRILGTQWSSFFVINAHFVILLDRIGLFFETFQRCETTLMRFEICMAVTFCALLRPQLPPSIELALQVSVRCPLLCTNK
jgi:hypothetical protein